MAYGVNAPWGLVPRRLLSGATWNGQMNEYYIQSGYSTNLFTGDPVYVNSSGYIIIATAGAGNPITGVFQGCKYTTSAGVVTFSPYWPASTATLGAASALALVADDPNLIFDVQCVNSSSTGITQANLYNNADLNAGGGGSTVTGLSSWGLDQATIGNGATKQLKILRLVPVPGNNFDTGSNFPYNNVEVVINNDYYKGGTGTVGV